MRLELGEPGGIVECVEELGHVAVMENDGALAAKLWGAAESARARIGEPRHTSDEPRYRRFVAMCREQLGESAFAEETREGRAMDLEAAVAAAMGRTPGLTA